MMLSCRVVTTFSVNLETVISSKVYLSYSLVLSPAIRPKYISNVLSGRWIYQAVYRLELFSFLAFLLLVFPHQL